MQFRLASFKCEIQLPTSLTGCQWKRMALGLAPGQVTSQSNLRSLTCRARSVSAPQTHPGHLHHTSHWNAFCFTSVFQTRAPMAVLRQTRPVLVALGIRWDVSPTPSLFVSVCGTVDSLLAAQKSQNFDQTRVKETHPGCEAGGQDLPPPHPLLFSHWVHWMDKKQVFRT